MKYRVGDKVRVNSRDGASCYIVGKVFTVRGVNPSAFYSYSLAGRNERFCEKELDLVKRGNGMAKRTFRLLKDTPEYRKGLIVEEACEDGDQEYVSTNGDDFVKFDDREDYFDNNEVSFSRDTVEKNPTWFEEVEMTWVAKVKRAVKRTTWRKK